MGLSRNCVCVSHGQLNFILTMPVCLRVAKHFILRSMLQVDNTARLYKEIKKWHSYFHRSRFTTTSLPVYTKNLFLKLQPPFVQSSLSIRFVIYPLLPGGKFSIHAGGGVDAASCIRLLSPDVVFLECDDNRMNHLLNWYKGVEVCSDYQVARPKMRLSSFWTQGFIHGGAMSKEFEKVIEEVYAAISCVFAVDRPQWIPFNRLFRKLLYSSAAMKGFKQYISSSLNFRLSGKSIMDISSLVKDIEEKCPDAFNILINERSCFLSNEIFLCLLSSAFNEHIRKRKCFSNFSIKNDFLKENRQGEDTLCHKFPSNQQVPIKQETLNDNLTKDTYEICCVIICGALQLDSLADELQKKFKEAQFITGQSKFCDSYISDLTNNQIELLKCHSFEWILLLMRYVFFPIAILTVGFICCIAFIVWLKSALLHGNLPKREKKIVNVAIKKTF